MIRLRPIIFGVTAAAIAVALYYAWALFSGKAKLRRAQQTRPQRRHDVKNLRGPHKRAYKRALELSKSGQVVAAAQILESFQLYREAVDLLEQYGRIREAAQILQRIRRPNRAGVIYLRHNMYSEAADCFEQAKMPLELGRAAKELGEYKRAADAFLAAGELAEAAECFIELGKPRDALDLYVRLKDTEKALEVLSDLLAQSDELRSFKFSKAELDLMCVYLQSGNIDPKIADVIIIHGRLVDVLLSLITQQKVRPASELYMRSTTDIGPQLINRNDLNNTQTETLALVLMTGGALNYAAILYERLGSFETAAEVFAQAEDFERAAYAYERAQMKEKAIDMRCRLAERGSKPARSIGDGEDQGAGGAASPVFALGDSSNVNKTMANLAFPQSPDTGSSGIHYRPPAPARSPTHAIGAFMMDDSANSTQIGHIPTQAQVTTNQTMSDEPSAAVDAPAIMADSPLFLDLSPTQHSQIWAVGEAVSLKEGEVLVDIGNDIQGLYIIIKGEVIDYAPLNSDDNIAIRSVGDVLGAAAVLSSSAYSCHLVAATAVDLRLFPRDAFQALLMRNGSIACKLYSAFCTSLLASYPKPQTQQRSA